MTRFIVTLVIGEQLMLCLVWGYSSDDAWDKAESLALYHSGSIYSVEED